MKIFRISDLWGILGAALFLVLVYLVFNNFVAANTILSTTFSGANTAFKTLQGR